MVSHAILYQGSWAANHTNEVRATSECTLLVGVNTNSNLSTFSGVDEIQRLNGGEGEDVPHQMPCQFKGINRVMGP